MTCDNKPASCSDPALALRLEAANLIPVVMNEQPGKLKKFIEDHAQDKSLYQYRCERYGDFLAVFMTRGPYPAQNPHSARKSNKLVAAINLTSSGTITLTEGSEPACDMTIGLTVQSSDYQKKPDGENDYGKPIYKTVPQYVYESTFYGSYPMMVEYSKNTSNYTKKFVHYSENPLLRCLNGIKIPGIARGARDDSVRFSGAGVTLHAPAGMGQMVYDAILAANAAYTEKV